MAACSTQAKTSAWDARRSSPSRCLEGGSPPRFGAVPRSQAGDPALARELSIGRPDLPREFDDSGLVERLGLSVVEADRVVEVRDHLGALRGPAELAVYAKLPEATVEAVRDRLPFLVGEPEHLPEVARARSGR